MFTSVTNRERALERLEQVTEIPLMIVAAFTIPLFIGPYLWHSDEQTVSLWHAVVWALFALDLSVKTALAPRRVAYLRSHWLDALVVLVPFIRPLRALLVFLYATRAVAGARRLLGLHGVVVYATFLVVIAATLITAFESGSNPGIDSFRDALWWTLVTVTTVGYGDVVPVSPEGRLVAYVVILGGITIFSAVTANFAALLVRPPDSADPRIDELLAAVRQLRREQELAAHDADRGGPASP